MGLLHKASPANEVAPLAAFATRRPLPPSTTHNPLINLLSSQAVELVLAPRDGPLAGLKKEALPARCNLAAALLQPLVEALAQLQAAQAGLWRICWRQSAPK